MQQIAASIPCFKPPQWALWEDQLLDLLSRAPLQILARYTRRDGSLLWPPFPNHQGVDGLDDAYESLHNWPMLYLVGGSDALIKACEREFDAITRQFARYPTGYGRHMVEEEYEGGYDWFHQGEGYRLFYDLCLARPSRERAAQAMHFAGYYLNEHVLPEPNYDADHRILRCPYVGSTGPNFAVFGDTWRRDLPQAYGRPWPEALAWFVGYWGLPFQDLPGVRSAADLTRAENAERFLAALQSRMGRSDAVSNLAATSLVMNAYLVSGQQKYREWVLEYVNA